jgi:hypothetical protein
MKGPFFPQSDRQAAAFVRLPTPLSPRLINLLPSGMACTPAGAPVLHLSDLSAPFFFCTKHEASITSHMSVIGCLAHAMCIASS